MKIGENKSGFTILELIFSVVASAILLLTVGTVLFMALRSWDQNNAYVTLRRDAAFAIEMMSRDIHESSDIITAGKNHLSLSNNVRNYVATYALNPIDQSMSCIRTDEANLPFIAGNIETFIATPQMDQGSTTANGVHLHLKMVVPKLDIAITNETFVHMRN